MDTELTTQPADQLNVHWRTRLRPWLDGLTDDEYFWEPVKECWTVHPDGSIGFAFPPPQPEPFTTIAWMAHVIVGVLAMRNHFHFGGPPADYQSWMYATDAATAVVHNSARPTHAGSTAYAVFDAAALASPCGPAESPYADYPMSTLVLHINREIIHHDAEIACLCDLYTHSH